MTTPVVVWRPGDRLWLASEKHVWVPATLEEINGNDVTFKQGNPFGEDAEEKTSSGTGDIFKKSTADLPKLEPVDDSQVTGEDDICSLSSVPQAALLHTVRVRYSKRLIYTRVGRILITMNPFTPLPIYSIQHIEQYKAVVDSTSLPPHIFGIAHDALRGVQTGNPNHVVLISGESGAGKTESAKLILSFIAEAVHSHEGNIQDRVLQTSPVFEAFGNATTTRNANSSRFGKWLDLHFNSSCEISGCALTQYLLETTRVCYQAEKERGYHIFFQMCRGLSSASESSRMPNQAKRQELKLKPPEEYRYLKSGLQNAPGIDDVRAFEDTLDGFESVGFDMDKQYEIFRLLSGILLLGNCDFAADGDASKMVNTGVCSDVSQLLGIKEDELSARLLVRTITVGGDKMTKPLTVEQSEKVRDGFSRMLYGRLFEWLVVQMNKALGDGKEPEKALGVLDIAGFESFDTNSLEQLLINLSNEYLQQSFNATIFTAELEEIAKEGIKLKQDISFADNGDILELISGKGGILDNLDELSQLGTSTDEKFANIVIQKHGKHARCSGPKYPKPVFMIRHFAGEVWYACEGMLEKNADKPPEGATELIRSSSIALLQDLAGPDDEGGPPGSGSHKATKRKIPTISSNFRNSMKSLMTKISNSDRHYVRCIKPNQEKKAFSFDSPMSMEQLLFSGILEAVRIRQIGFGARIPFAQFATKYGCICDKESRAPIPLPKDAALKMCMEKMIEALEKKLGPKVLVPGTMVVGLTKMLMKTEALQALDQARGVEIQARAIVIQRFARKAIARKKVKRMKEMQKKFLDWLMSMGSGTVAGTCSFTKQLGSTKAATEELQKIDNMLDEAQSIGFQNGTVKSILPIRNKLQQEADIISELNSLKESKDAVLIERVLGRAAVLHLGECALYQEIKKRLNYLVVELPLELARAAGVEDDGSNGAGMVAPTKEELLKIVAGEIKVTPTGPADQRKTMTQNLQERRTVTGCGPQAQLAILKSLEAAADVCDVDELERYLGDAISQGINPQEMEPYKALHMNFQEPAFLQAKLEEAEKETDSDLKEERKKNLLEQFERLKVESKPVDPYQEDKDEFEEYDLALFPGLKSAASWRGHRKSVANLDGIEGRWKKARITGNKVKWNDGTVSSLERTGANTAKMEWEGEWFTGELKSDGKLHWSDGDIWERPKGKSGADKKKQMLCHSKEVIQESLTNLKPNEEELAVQNFRNILYYMADKPAQDLVRQASFDYIIGLAMRAGFCNEVFIQVLKQLTDNPSPRSSGLGWQLLLLICQSVLPGEELIPYVRKFLGKVAASKDIEAAARAQNCLQALEMRTLPVLRGHLFKKKPQTLTLKSFDKRYFVVGNHQMFWWATMEDSARPESARPRGGPLCKGVIDFIAEEVEIHYPSSETMFELRPKRGAWTKRFEHAAGDPKRTFTFDCKGTEYTREVWCNVIQAHLDYSDRFRSQTMSMMSLSDNLVGGQFNRTSTTDLE